MKSFLELFCYFSYFVKHFQVVYSEYIIRREVFTMTKSLVIKLHSQSLKTKECRLCEDSISLLLLII